MNNSDVANILKQDLERKELIGVKTNIVLSSQGYVVNTSKIRKAIINNILQDCVDNYDCLTDDKLEAIRLQANNV
mgnify:CR=1 FL=1